MFFRIIAALFKLFSLPYRIFKMTHNREDMERKDAEKLLKAIFKEDDNDE